MKIRQATLDDVPQLVEHRRLGCRPFLRFLTAPYWDDWLRRFGSAEVYETIVNDQSSALYVCDADGEIVAQGGVTILDDAGVRVGHMHSNYSTLPSQGIASKIFDLRVQWAARQCAERLDAGVFADNPDAVRWLTNRGFVVHETAANTDGVDAAVVQLRRPVLTVQDPSPHLVPARTDMPWDQTSSHDPAPWHAPRSFPINSAQALRR